MELFQEFAETQLQINRYFNALDRRDYPTLLDCLTDDVYWRVSSERAGRDDVALAMEERPANAVVRHLATNLDVSIVEGEIDVFFLLITFAYFTKDGDTVP